MGGETLNCPLCCNQTFNTKQSLREHLSNALKNVNCPVCNYECTSIHNLVEHLDEDTCQSNKIVHNVIFEESNHENNSIENSPHVDKSEIEIYENDIITNTTNNFDMEHSYETQVDQSNKMYVELFSKQMNPCLQTRELKLVKENGESRYMIITQDDVETNAGSAIVTKQNIDGTISLTTLKDMKMENEPLPPPENIQEDNQEEIYSCNTCKVSFSSVIEHIQNYHNDQDVVVEEPIDETHNLTLPIEFGQISNDETIATNDRQQPRRVITDTGNIVEEPLVFGTNENIMKTEESMDMDTMPQPIKKEKKQMRVFAKKIGEFEKQSDDVNKDNVQTDEKDKSGPYHKVIVKEVPTSSGFAVKTYQCLSCDLSVTNLNEFKVHPCKVLKYPCPCCPVAYDNSKSLCAHMKAHKTKPDFEVNPVSYECSVCCTVFPTNKSLKLHKRMHDPIKARPIMPPVENTDGSEVSDGSYLCNICNKMIPVDYRVIHQNSHKLSAKMNCSICNKKFSSAEYLEMHMNVHNLDKVPVNNQDESLPYNCLYCSRRFARPHEKVKHERIHTGEKPHSCEICGKSFRVSYCLTLHMRTHTGARPYSCPHCGKRFKAHSVYNHHLLTHSEVRAYKCPFCPKAFKTAVQLAGHKNSHTKPFSCQHCNRPFASLYAVRVHTETHARQNNLKFSCELCGASYARAFALKDHVKQAHSQEQIQQQQPSPQTITADDDWMVKDNTDAEADADPDEDLNKDDLAHEIDLGMSTNELIVP